MVYTSDRIIKRNRNRASKISGILLEPESVPESDEVDLIFDLANDSM